MAKITIGPGIGMLIAKILGLFKRSGSSNGGMPSRSNLFKQVAGPIPSPMLPTLEKGSDGKYKSEEAFVPLTGKPPCSNRMQGFLYKPIGSAWGTVSLYMPIEAPVQEMAILLTNGNVLWSQQSPGAPGDDGRPFWRTDVARTALAGGGWVRARLANGQVLWYPIANGLIRNGSGHGNTPPHLYPFC